MLTAALDCAPQIDQKVPQRLDVACFGMGCFFESEPRFGVVKGVWRTLVGYAGGKYDSPSYDDAGDHAEVVMVEYDSLVISYGQLLEIFLLWHCSSRGPSSSPRHASRIFVKSEFERRLAQAALERHELSEGNHCQAQVSMYKIFYEAEEWCQKYCLRASTPLMEEMNRLYPNEKTLIRSTLATWLNGIVGQKSFPLSRLPEALELYDLSEEIIGILEQWIV